MTYRSLSRYINLAPLWVWWTFFGIFFAFLSWLIFHVPKATLVGHNHTHNPVVTYWVNDSWGGNRELDDEGWKDVERRQYIKGHWDDWYGMTCCWSFRRDEEEILWYVDVTTKEEYEEYEERRRSDTSLAVLTLHPPRNEEEHTLHVIIPERTREDRYLHVHFLPNHEVRLGWSPDLISPYADLPNRPDVARYQEQ
ncbi:DUF3304 domain-containing protein [Halomonas heilongjiangensis]|uniref:DUF3304 domain-containing protein n=1 Tax=Halomonas heilongjiangensis TaxID=1387883 RepID=UPI001474C72A|nr:DUF3304 domain-containing protein [Halomonas heilongjiangensis]